MSWLHDHNTLVILDDGLNGAHWKRSAVLLAAIRSPDSANREP